MKRYLAMRLRFLADRIDPVGAPRRTNLSFTFEKHRGLVVDMDGRRGCPLWYYGMADYDRAHNEAGTAVDMSDSDVPTGR